MDAHATLALVMGFYALMRIAEGIVNRRHTKLLNQRGARSVRPDGFFGIVAVQALFFAGLLVEGFLLPTTGAILWVGTWPSLGLATSAVALRFWCIATLGDRWAFRVWILPEEPLVVGGPYRFLKHPNYVAVFLEYVAVPLAFGLWFTAAIIVPLGAWSLLHRKHIEEGALSAFRS